MYSFVSLWVSLVAVEIRKTKLSGRVVKVPRRFVDLKTLNSMLVFIHSVFVPLKLNLKRKDVLTQRISLEVSSNGYGPIHLLLILGEATASYK